MELKINVTRDDYWAFNKHAMRGQFFGSLFARPRLLLGLAAAVLVLSVVLTVLRGDLSWIAEMWRSGAGKLIFVLLALMLVAVAALGILVLLTRRQVKDMPSEKSDTLGDRTVRVTEKGIHSVSTQSESFRQWDGVLSVDETSDHVFVYTDTMSAYIVPKHAFPSAEACAEFVETCRRYWQAARSR